MAFRQIQHRLATTPGRSAGSHRNRLTDFTLPHDVFVRLQYRSGRPPERRGQGGASDRRQARTRMQHLRCEGCPRVRCGRAPGGCVSSSARPASVSGARYRHGRRHAGAARVPNTSTGASSKRSSNTAKARWASRKVRLNGNSGTVCILLLRRVRGLSFSGVRFDRRRPGFGTFHPEPGGVQRG